MASRSCYSFEYVWTVTGLDTPPTIAVPQYDNLGGVGEVGLLVIYRAAEFRSLHSRACPVKAATILTKHRSTDRAYNHGDANSHTRHSGDRRSRVNIVKCWRRPSMQAAGPTCDLESSDHQQRSDESGESGHGIGAARERFLAAIDILFFVSSE